MSFLVSQMQNSAIYDPVSRNSFLNKNYKCKKNSSGSIFRLPRSILSSQTLSARNQPDSLTKQKAKQQMRNTKFIIQYRSNLRKTIFSQTKGMLKHNKFDRLQNQKILSMKQLQKSSQKKISPYAVVPNKNNELPSTTNILYKTIVNHQYNSKRKIQPLQLAVQKLPIIQLQKRRKKPLVEFSEQDQHSQYTYQNAKGNGNINIRRQKRVASHFDKNLIQPWDIIQQLNLQAEQP